MDFLGKCDKFIFTEHFRCGYFCTDGSSVIPLKLTTTMKNKVILKKRQLTGVP